MATWEALKSYILANYKILEDNGTILAMGFSLDGGRHQRVMVGYQGDVAGSQWAEVATPVATESQISHRDLLVRNSRMVCGGLAIVDSDDGDSLVIFRHSFPLADLDPSEFEGPLSVAVRFGDQLEHELTGSDTF